LTAGVANDRAGIFRGRAATANKANKECRHQARCHQSLRRISHAACSDLVGARVQRCARLPRNRALLVQFVVKGRRNSTRYVSSKLWTVSSIASCLKQLNCFRITRKKITFPNRK
jgi:hypothetical protein